MSALRATKATSFSAVRATISAVPELASAVVASPQMTSRPASTSPGGMDRPSAGITTRVCEVASKDSPWTRTSLRAEDVALERP